MQEPISTSQKTIQKEAYAPVYALETERLLLRPMVETDTGALHEIMSNPDSMKYWSCAPHTSHLQTANFVAKSIHSTAANYDLSVFLKPASPSTHPGLIGKIGIWDGGVGFIFHPSVWRKGIAFEAMKVFLDQHWCIRPMAGCVKADVDPRNTSCLALLGKFGFVETGREGRTYLTHLGWCDSVYLELGRPEKEGCCLNV